VFAHLKALEAYMKNTGSLPVNLKIIIEGEEEIGSEHLDSFVSEHKELLRADLVMISDSDMFAKGVPSVCYGLRGLAYMEVEVTGPNGDLHSGSFGGSLHNPIQALSEIIASLHDKNGKITIPGFYDDVRPLMKAERNAFKKLPWNDRKYAKSLGLKDLYGEKGFTTLERLWARPTLECNGIWGGYAGEGAKTVLPSKAYAKISMRIVPDQSSAKVAKLFERHLKKIAPKTISLKVRALHGGEPAITPIDSPGVQAAVAALEKGFGKKPLYQREGGSIPIVVQFKNLLGIDTVLLGFGLPDGNAHAPNEFIVLDNFFGGIRTCLHFYNELPNFWHKGGKKTQKITG
jgi:acetylornithine deacetylase/succinyl-diaminopimelate desuccinylase-like protein